MLAILLAVSILLNLDGEKRRPQRVVHVFVDGQAILYTNRNRRDTLGQAYVRRVGAAIVLVRRLDYTLIIDWIPAHYGLLGNENADVAAREATRWRKISRGRRTVKVDSGQTALH